MNDKTVLLCYDNKEEVLAAALKACIDEVFKYGNNKMVNVELCPSPSDAANQPDSWKKSLDKAFVDDEKSLIFVLCSPFSIGQPWVNFISGAATIKIENTAEKKRPKIIPICHSGQKSKDLPHYLLSRQAMDIQHDSFLNALTSTLDKELGKPKNSIFQKLLAYKKLNFIKKIFIEHQALSNITADRQNNKLKSFDKAILVHLRNISYSVNTKDKPKNSNETEYFNVTLQRKGEIIKITHTPLPEKNSSLSEVAKLEQVNKMHNLLARRYEKTAPNEKEPINEVNAVVAIGVQNCLYNETNKSFYVGLVGQLEVDPNFKSYSSPTGIFKPGYEILAQHIPAEKKNIQDLFVIGNSFKKEDVTSSSPVSPSLYELIKERAEVMGHTLWNIQLSDKEISIATIFINRSEPVPRFEIGVWKFINITSLEDSYIVQNFGGGTPEQKDSYWIWVRNGEIYYWSFPDEDLIPRHFTNKDNACQSGKLVLVKTEYLCDTYGRPEKYTPFAPDDALGEENVVKDRFSAAARELLSCF